MTSTFSRGILYRVPKGSPLSSVPREDHAATEPAARRAAQRRQAPKNQPTNSAVDSSARTSSPTLRRRHPRGREPNSQALNAQRGTSRAQLSERFLGTLGTGDLCTPLAARAKACKLNPAVVADSVRPQRGGRPDAERQAPPPSARPLLARVALHRRVPALLQRLCTARGERADVGDVASLGAGRCSSTSAPATSVKR